ncbi:MAG TPA: glycosyl hydrolase family 65 protein, partial [Gemmatimonadaceae bacterium]|nr:glycosyl hydrolase family 65 protein [Gemmatimonadaceae bacterium]
MRLSLLGAAALALLTTPASAQVLDARVLPERYGWLDNRDWGWYARRIPLFESPERSIDSTYYYRWQLVTKHLTYGDPATGYTFTEFIDRPFWSGAYGAISCPLGHQMYELRWLKDARIVRDFARYWFTAPGAQPRSYSNWYGDAVWATYLVNGDRAYLGRALPFMKRQLAGWDAERYDSIVGLYHWDGLHDGMERSINSRQTDDIDEGADGYRPTLNSYIFADLRAIARASALLGDSAGARSYAERADSIRARVLRELWDPRRGFFLHQFAHDEKDGVRARTRTWDSGKYAGNAHGRELIGYVPWQFELPPPNQGYERAWAALMDTARFLAPFGPTTAERHDPLFYISPRCCWWSGNSWPYATTQTLVALANVVNDYPQDVVTKRDWMELFRIYTRTQRKNGRPYIAEAANPDDGSWEGHDTFQHSEHYFHSGYIDPLITGLIGLRPRADDSLEVNPLAPGEWKYFALDGVEYRGHRLTILWDRDGTRYGRGTGLTILADGRVLATAPRLGRVVAYLKPVQFLELEERPPAVNLAVNNGRGAYPWVTASWSAPSTPAFALIDGNYRYDRDPPNRWTDSGSVNAKESLVLDFGAPRPVETLLLYFLDDGAGSAIRAPASYALEIWENGRWARAPEKARVPARPEGHRPNGVTFARRVLTSRIRLTFVPRPRAWVGLTEIEAWA